MQTNSKNASGDATEKLCSAILSLRDREECLRFLQDLLTPQEISTLAQRLQVAQMLYEGYTYDGIRSQVSTSSCTITRISTELQYGTGGYRMVLERMAEEEKADTDEDAAKEE